MYTFPHSRYPKRRYTLEEIKADWELAKSEGWLDDSPHNISWDWYIYCAIQNGIIVREKEENHVQANN